jgi:hypothetical protein
MTLSRRNFLETGALAALGYTAFPEPAAAQATPVRRSIGQLGLADPAVQTLREGVRLLKTKPVSDPLNWSNLADIHLNFCPHGNWFFLPWHRAYLVMYERLIPAVSGQRLHREGSLGSTIFASAVHTPASRSATLLRSPKMPSGQTQSAAPSIGHVKR